MTKNDNKFEHLHHNHDRFDESEEFEDSRDVCVATEKVIKILEDVRDFAGDDEENFHRTAAVSKKAPKD